MRVRRPRATGKSRTAWSVALLVATGASAMCAAPNAWGEPPPRALAVLPVPLVKETPPPAPAITKAPASLTYDTSAHFEFSDQSEDGSFQCRLDNGPVAPCGSAGITYQSLGLGRHCFYVLAVHGQYRSAPREFCWRCRPIKVSGGFTIGGNAPGTLFTPGPVSRSTWPLRTRLGSPSRC